MKIIEMGLGDSDSAMRDASSSFDFGSSCSYWVSGAEFMSTRRRMPISALAVQVTRTTQPSMKRPLAAIQLPATRTAMRAHRARTEVTCPAKIDTTTKMAHAIPAATSPLDCAFASSIPLRPPLNNPMRIAMPAIDFSAVA